MRSDIPFSSGWKFIDAPLDPRWLAQNDLPFPLVQDGSWQSVDIPHSIQELPLNHFDEKIYQKTATYFREFAGPALEDGEKALLEFDGVSVACKVWLNGAEAGVHTGPYTPFSCDITRLVRQGKPNHLFVEVSAEENPEVPPFGGVVDYLVYGGIYRAVNLRIRPSDRIISVFADSKVEFLGASAADTRFSAPSALARLNIEAQLERGGAGRPLTLFAMLKKNGNFIAQAVSQIEDPGQTSISLAFPEISPVILWDIGHPELYDLEVSLIRDGESIDTSWHRIGFRKAEFTPEGFFLNGKRLFLRGLNRHQSWPYAGYAMGPGPQREDARILKEEFGATIVRTSHYPQSPHFLDECDRLGLLVFAELPGWQHVGQADWKEHALADLETMIIRDRNHPSIILWGVR
ncbi:MAG: glycoside hydrolase family 2 protein, partial [Spirochaetia bacterium]|nr:glycoside hydrolase family 2 protein [Spirochaetia bacterium]